MSDLFKYNPTPWTHARCGDNWDINLPSEPDAVGVGVVATVFAGEDIARFLAAAPQLYDGCNALLGLIQLLLDRDDLTAELREVLTTNHRIDEAQAAVAKARGEQQ